MKTVSPFVQIPMLAALLGSTALLGAKEVDFAKDIQPILVQNCIECHGPEKDKGKLRFDTKAEAFKEDYNIIPGNAAESEVYIRVTFPPDHDDIMPAKGDPLTKEQTDLLKAWIDQGAPWPDDLVIATAKKPSAEEDPRTPVEPSEAERKAISQLQELGIQVRPVAMNVSWTLANFRGVQPETLDQALPLLAEVKTLEDLNLAGLPVKDDHLKHIAGLNNLLRLHLEKTEITDAGLAHLQGLNNLVYLNLYNTKVSDAGLEHLMGLKRLKNLYLWQTDVTDEGAEKLQAALPQTDINRGWEITAAKLKVQEEAKKREEAEQKAKEEAEKKKAQEEAAKKAEAEKKAAEKKEAEENAQAKKEEKPADAKKDQ